METVVRVSASEVEDDGGRFWLAVMCLVRCDGPSYMFEEVFERREGSDVLVCLRSPGLEGPAPLGPWDSARVISDRALDAIPDLPPPCLPNGVAEEVRRGAGPFFQAANHGS